MNKDTFVKPFNHPAGFSRIKKRKFKNLKLEPESLLIKQERNANPLIGMGFNPFRRRMQKRAFKNLQ